MWYVIFEVPGGLILFFLVLLMAFTDSAGEWVLENMTFISAITYTAEIIMGMRRCIRYKKMNISLLISFPFTAISIWASTSYLLLIIAEIAEIATGGFLGLLGLLLAAPLAILSCVICKAPGVFVNILAKDREVDPALVILDGIITVVLCLICRWFYGYI